MKKGCEVGPLAAAFFVVSMWASPTIAQDEGFFSGRTASVTIGPYLRASVGSAEPSFDSGYWRPPGFIPDPEIRFDIDGDSVVTGTIAFGYDWQGWRGELAFSHFGASSASGPCSSASDGSSCATHADIDNAKVESTAVMTNVYYAPFEARGSQSVFQPFIVGGVGFAGNRMGDWTRSNPGATRPIRTFEGNLNTSFAWSVGVGASYQVTKPGRWPVLIEGSWRYYDLGSAEGGAQPLPGNGASQPVQPLKFDMQHSVFEFGVRIPLQKF